MNKIERFFHKYIINFIAWYMREKCGGASHVYNYGDNGRYIVIMNEIQYRDYNSKVR